MKRLFKDYWMVLLVGAFFALTSIYNSFGISLAASEYNRFHNKF